MYVQGHLLFASFELTPTLPPLPPSALFPSIRPSHFQMPELSMEGSATADRH